MCAQLSGDLGGGRMCSRKDVLSHADWWPLLSTVALSTAALRTATVALNISFYDNKFIS